MAHLRVQCDHDIFLSISEIYAGLLSAGLEVKADTLEVIHLK